LSKGTKVIFREIRKLIEKGDSEIPIEVNGQQIYTLLDVSQRQRQALLAGGTLNLVRKELKSQNT
jgi:aconitate hydratase